MHAFFNPGPLRRRRRVLVFAPLVLSLWACRSADAQPRELVKWEMQEIDASVQIGYGVAIGDVDGDGRADIILADQKQFVWYQNPSWRKFILAENLTNLDNVCVAARDVNGDGKVEIAVGAEWNPGDTLNSGAVFYLVPPADRRERWRAIRLHHEPVVHRMRWVKSTSGFVLVVAPLHGRGNRNGEGDGVRLLAYQPPPGVLRDGSSDGEWTTTTLHDSFHVTHNLDVGQWNAASDAEEVLYLGREGAVVLEPAGDAWRERPLQRVLGGGEIRMGGLSDGRRWVATIEPFHGERLAIYYADSPGSAGFSGGETLDNDLKQGHAIAVADLAGDASDEIVAGWRNPNGQQEVGLKMFHHDGKTWHWQWVDRNGMATEDARIADLNADGKPDIIASGCATKNLRVYWNRGASDRPRR